MPTREQIETQYQKLPEELKEAIYAVETSDKIIKIGKKFSLHIDQLGQLAEMVGMVILGFTPHQQFSDEIRAKLNLSPAVVEQITTAINTEVFLPIRETLRQLTATPKDLPSKDQVLGEIENPPPAGGPTPTESEKGGTETEEIDPSVMEERMRRMFHLPRVENAEKPQPDPYREPIE